MKETINISYTTDINYTISYEPLEKFTKIDFFINGSELYTVELKIKETQSGFYNKEMKNNWVGIITKEHLERLCANPSEYNELEEKFRLPHSMWLMKKEYLPHITQYGNNDSIRALDGKEKLDVASLKSSNPLKDGKKEDYQFIQLVPNEMYQKLWMDSNGKRHIEPFLLEYINAQLDNETYNLDELVEHLSKRDDISFITNNGRYSQNIEVLHAPLTGNEKTINGIITNIPHYNIEENRTESITILYYPKEQDIDKIMAWSYEDKNKKEHIAKKIYNLEHYIVKEILGGLPFVKNLELTNKEVEIPKRKFKK